MNAPNTWIVAAREPVSAATALDRACRLAAQADRIVIAHVPSRSLLALLGLGEMRRAAPDAAPGDGPDAGWVATMARDEAASRNRCVEPMLLDGAPATAIAALARETDAAAIVVGSQREGSLREFVLGSTSLHILREARCPVLVARSAGTSYGRVLAAVDADPSGQRVATVAQKLLPDATLTLLHAWRVPAEGQLRQAGLADAKIEALREQARTEAGERLARLHAFVPQARVELRHGHAASAILEAVGALRPDLLAIGRHRGSAIEEQVLGSVTQFVLYNASCDLLLVP